MKASILAIAFATLAMTGCASMSTRESNVLGGAAIGGLAGAAIGGSTAATVGGAAIGGLIGNEVGKDKERQERRDYNQRRYSERYYDNRGNRYDRYGNRY